MVRVDQEAKTARITCDIGGTFTDVVVSDASGNLTVAKALTRPEHLFGGLHEALALAAEQLGELARGAARPHCALRLQHHPGDQRDPRGPHRPHGASLHRGLPGHPGAPRGRIDASLRLHAPVPRSRTSRDSSRSRSRSGSAPTARSSSPLDEEAAREVVRAARPRGRGGRRLPALVDRQPGARARARRLLEEELPGVPYTLSHRLNPIVREYRRDLGHGDRRLAEAADAGAPARDRRRVCARRGFAGELLAASLVRRRVPMDGLIERPIFAARSGPSLAPGRRPPTASTSSTAPT